MLHAIKKCAFLSISQDSEHGEMWGQMDTAVIIRTLETMYQASGDAALVQSMVSHLSEKVIKAKQ